MEYQLRFATESDRSFLYQLHCSTMRSHIEKTWGWDDAWQRRDFDRRFREQQVSVIEVDGRDAGGLWLELRADALHLADLQISPDLQRQGSARRCCKASWPKRLVVGSRCCWRCFRAMRAPSDCTSALDSKLQRWRSLSFTCATRHARCELSNKAMDADAAGLLAHPGRRGSSPIR